MPSTPQESYTRFIHQIFVERMSQQQRRQPKKPKKPRTNRDPVDTPPAPPDFSKQCHFTQHNFACNHHTWVTDPKITHVLPCKCKHHKNLCDNMAKSTKEVWFDAACSSCQGDAAKDSVPGLGLDPRLNMAEAVKKRIFELEPQKKIIVDSLPSKKTPDKLATTSSSSKPVSKTKSQTTESDWRLEEVPAFQPLPESIDKVEEIPKLNTKQIPKPTTKKEAPPTAIPKTDKPGDFDDNSDSDEELYQLGKEREEWLSVPEAKNGNGVADKSTGLLGTFYNVITWKSMPKFVLKEVKPEAPPKQSGKEDPDSDEPWEDHGEWVHVFDNVEDN